MSQRNRNSPQNKARTNLGLSEDVLMAGIDDDVPIASITAAVAQDSANQNTKKAYDRIKNEWRGYCQYKCGDLFDDDQYTTQVTAEKVADFVFFQAFRRKTTHKVGSGRIQKRVFDGKEYEDVKKEYLAYYRAWKADSHKVPIPHPSDGGIAISALMQIRAVLRSMWLSQSYHKRNGYAAVGKCTAFGF